MLNDEVYDIIETLSSTQQRCLQIVMYLKVLGTHAIDLANFTLDLLTDNVAQR